MSTDRETSPGQRERTQNCQGGKTWGADLESGWVLSNLGWQLISVKTAPQSKRGFQPQHGSANDNGHANLSLTVQAGFRHHGLSRHSLRRTGLSRHGLSGASLSHRSLRHHFESLQCDSMWLDFDGGSKGWAAKSRRKTIEDKLRCTIRSHVHWKANWDQPI